MSKTHSFYFFLLISEYSICLEWEYFKAYIGVEVGNLSSANYTLDCHVKILYFLTFDNENIILGLIQTFNILYYFKHILNFKHTLHTSLIFACTFEAIRINPDFNWSHSTYQFKRPQLIYKFDLKNEPLSFS